MTRLVGILLIVLSAAGFGTLAIFGRYAYGDGLDAFTILFLRFGLATLAMLPWLWLRGVHLPRGPVLWRLVGMGAIGYVGQSLAYFTALRYASPGLVALLLYLYPVFVTILSALWLSERVSREKLFALGIALVGLALTVGPAGGQLLGVVIAILAAMIYSVYIVIGSRVMQQASALQSSTVIFASAATALGMWLFLQGAHWPASSVGWLAIAAIVVFATVLPAVSFLAGLERVGPTTASMLSVLEPVVTIALAAWLFDETPPPIALLGGGLILVAVLLLTQSELRGRRNV